MKLRQVVDKVKRNTEEMSELSKELTNISLGVSLEDKSYAGAVGQNSKQVHRRGKVAPIPASANALKTVVKAMFHDEDRKKNIILFGLGEEDNEILILIRKLERQGGQGTVGGQSKASTEASC